MNASECCITEGCNCAGTQSAEFFGFLLYHYPFVLFSSVILLAVALVYLLTLGRGSSK